MAGAALAAATLLGAVVALVVQAGRGGPEVPVVELAAPPDLRNGRAFVQSNLWVAGDRRYAVWVLPDGGARAGVLESAEGSAEPAWQTVDLAAVPGNPLAVPTADDLHNTYAIAVDADGFIHVIGNMHSDELRYARSTRPHDLTSLAAATIDDPTLRVTYPQLVGLPDGTLLFFRRVGVPGDGEIRLDRLAAGSDAWEPLGTILDGRPGGESPYLHDVAVDPRSGAIHLLVTWRGDAPEATNDVTYARSADGGSTWTTSGGEQLATPITHESIELVIDTRPRGSALVNQGGFAVDGNGVPHAVVMSGSAGGPVYTWIHRDEEGWRRENVENLGIGGRPEVVAAGDRVWIVGTSAGVVEIHELGEDGGRPVVTPVPSRWEPAADSNGFADGVLELLVPAGADPVLVRLRLEELS